MNLPSPPTLEWPLVESASSLGRKWGSLGDRDNSERAWSVIDTEETFLSRVAGASDRSILTLVSHGWEWSVLACNACRRLPDLICCDWRLPKPDLNQSKRIKRCWNSPATSVFGQIPAGGTDGSLAARR
jgi:hypothetical protein